MEEVFSLCFLLSHMYTVDYEVYEGYEFLLLQPSAFSLLRFFLLRSFVQLNALVFFNYYIIFLYLLFMAIFLYHMLTYDKSIIICKHMIRASSYVNIWWCSYINIKYKLDVIQRIIHILRMEYMKERRKNWSTSN